MTERSHLKDNRGFSLVELIVAVAIAGILAVIVGGIMVSSAATYGRANAETTVQSRAQIVMNQIEDLVIDTRGEVDYGYRTSGGGVQWGQLTDEGIAEDASRVLRLYDIFTGDSKRYICDLEWEKKDTDSGTLSYRQYETTDGKEPVDSGEEGLLSDDVVSFACDLTALSSNRIVGVDLILKKGPRQYHTYKNISIRNPLAVSHNTVSTTNAVELVITTNTLTVEPNMDVPLYGARVNILSGTPSTGVVYEVMRPASGMYNETKVVDGKNLHIHQSERTKLIKIKASSVEDPSKFGYIVAYNRRVNAITSLSVVSDTGKIEPGANLTITPQLDVSPGARDSAAETEQLHKVKLRFRFMGARGRSWSELYNKEGSSFTFQIPSDADAGDRYDFYISELIHVSAYNADTGRGGLSTRTNSYSNGVTYGNDNNRRAIIEIEGNSEDAQSVLYEDQVVHRGQTSVQLSSNNLLSGLNSAEFDGTPVLHFFYRAKEARRVTSSGDFDHFGTYNNAIWNEDADKFSWANVNENYYGRLTSRYYWKEIPTHTNNTFVPPDDIFVRTSDWHTNLNCDQRFQFIAVAGPKRNGTYELCGKGEFLVPGYRPVIDDIGLNDYKTFRLFYLRGDTTLPAEGTLTLGQVDRAFGNVRYSDWDDSSEKGVGDIELYVNHREKEYYFDSFWRWRDNDWEDNKQIKNNDKIISAPTAGQMTFNVKITNLEKAHLHYPTIEDYCHYVSTNNNRYWYVNNFCETYYLHPVASYRYGCGNYRYIYNKDNNGFSEEEIKNGNKFNNGYRPYAAVEMRLGNATLEYNVKNFYGLDTDTWRAFAAYIPPPGSDDDLLKQYSLKQLSTTYRPAGSQQPVRIKNIREDGTIVEDPYLIQMRVKDGVRYIRIWSIYKDSYRETTNSFSASAANFIGEYHYNEDSDHWDRDNTSTPNIY